jgi:hypothetical protein
MRAPGPVLKMDAGGLVTLRVNFFGFAAIAL